MMRIQVDVKNMNNRNHKANMNSKNALGGAHRKVWSRVGCGLACKVVSFSMNVTCMGCCEETLVKPQIVLLTYVFVLPPSKGINTIASLLVRLVMLVLMIHRFF